VDGGGAAERVGAAFGEADVLDLAGAGGVVSSNLVGGVGGEGGGGETYTTNSFMVSITSSMGVLPLMRWLDGFVSYPPAGCSCRCLLTGTADQCNQS
jgi:hypothetical protein